MPYKDKSKRKLYEQQYRIKNKDKIAERERLYREKNRERDADKQKEWKNNNPDKVYAQRRRVNERRKNELIAYRIEHPIVRLTVEEKKEKAQQYNKLNYKGYEGYTEKRRTQNINETKLLKDNYVKKKLRRKGFTTDQINQNTKIIELQRFMIKTKRLKGLK